MTKAVSFKRRQSEFQSMPPKRGSRGRGGGKGNHGRGRGKGDYRRDTSKKQVRLLGGATDASQGKEKVVDIRVTNQDGEGFFGQALYRLLCDKDGRALLQTICNAKFPDVIENGDYQGNSLGLGNHQHHILGLLASAVGASGASAATPTSVPNSGAANIAQLINNYTKGAPSQNNANSILQSSASPTPPSSTSTSTVCKLSLDTVATLCRNGTIKNADYPAWCTKGGFSIEKLYQRIATQSDRGPPGTYQTPTKVSWQDLVSPSSGPSRTAPDSAASNRSSASTASVSSSYSMKSNINLERLMGFDMDKVNVEQQTVASDELTMQAQLNTIISNLFLHKSPQHGVNIAVVKTYVEKWNDDLDAPGTKQERLNMLNEGPGKKGFLDVLSACGRDFLKRNPDCLKKTTPSRKNSSTRAKQSKRGRGGKDKAKDGNSSEDNRSVAEELEDAANEDTSTMDLTGTGSAASGGTSTLERLDSAAGGGSEVRANRSILCDCLSLSDFPSHALSIHPTHLRLTIPSSNMTYAPSSRDSIRARSLMHSLDVAIAAGYLSLNLVVKYTCICIQGSSHVLTRSHLDRQPTRHGCYYPLSISPHHLHRWYRILSDIVLDLIGTHGPTDSRVMCICTIKTRVGLCILRYRAKRGHIRSCECIDSLLMYMHTFDGSILNRLPRNVSINALYVKFSVYHGYCYIGETGTTTRFYDHMRMMHIPENRLQRVHIVMGREGTHLHDTLVVNFGSGFDRIAFETALIHQYSSMNKYLLNVRQRRNSKHDSKALQLKRTLHLHRDSTAPLNKRRRHLVTASFIRPYIGTPIPTHVIQPTRIPCVILFGGGIGGVTDGLLRSGKFDIRAVYEYDIHACTSHRKRYPSIPVVQHTLGGDLNQFISTLIRYLPRSMWSYSLIQASPPCRDLSRANNNRFHRDDAMRLVDWTLALVDVICPAAYMIENVPKMIRLLSPTDRQHRHSHVFDLAYYVPQRRMRVMITNFPLDAYITPLSPTPLPASNVLPTTPARLHIMNRHGWTSSLTEPSLTIVGAGMYMYDTRSKKRSPMPIKHAQVLQGFAFSMDIERYEPSIKRQRLAIGDAVPPPFIYACGIACFKYIFRRVACSLSALLPCTLHSTDSPLLPRYYHIANTNTDSTTDLAYLVLECASDEWQLIVCTHGTTDIHVHTSSSTARLVGECMMFIDGIIDLPSLATGYRALSTGRCNYIAVRLARYADTIPECMMSTFRSISHLAPQWDRFDRRMIVFDTLRPYSYSELHHLYNMSQYIDDGKIRARVRYTLTRYSQFRYHVHPSPTFSMSLPACFGMRRSILTRIVWCIIRKFHLHVDILRDIQRNVTYSYAANPSVKDILCNARSFCKRWRIDDIWPCTCDAIMQRMHIPFTAPHTTTLHFETHIHTFMRDCGGDFTDVFDMNLNDICEPDITHLASSVPDALRTCLSTIKQFACDLRQKHTHEFRYICTDGLPHISIPRTDVLSISIVKTISALGLPIDYECARLIQSLSASIQSFPDNSLCKASRIEECARFISNDAVCFYCDKNGGVGTICCPKVAWHAMHDKLWSNNDYRHTSITPSALQQSHYTRYMDGAWHKFSRFRKGGDPGNDPFIIVKYKDLAKYRPILSAFKHSLKHTHSRVSTALNVALRAVATDSPIYANTLSTFAAAQSTVTQWNSSTALNTNPHSIVSGYAGDISSMFDKLDGTVVLRALPFILDLAARSTSRRYNLRSGIRSHITLHLSDPARHGIGINYNGEACVTISFPQIMDVCEHYIHNTHFYMSSVLILLQLGIPQGGPLSGPLSQIFTIYCEHLFHTSLYDYNSVSQHGIVRIQDLTDLGKRTLFPDGCMFELGDTIVMHILLKRYADDCRAVMLHTPCMQPAVTRYLHAYKHTCYHKPCELEDEADSPSLQFLQGMFVFSPNGCIARYESKNFAHFASTGRPVFRSMQHYDSYCMSPRNTRYSTIAGKLSEIDSFSSSDACRTAGVLTLIPDLVHLRYPTSLVIKALYVRTRKTTNNVWRDMIPTVQRYMLLQYQYYYGSGSL